MENLLNESSIDFQIKVTLKHVYKPFPVMGGKHDIGHYPHKYWIILKNTYWCVLRREFSEMIHWLTINHHPSNPSNPTHPATLRLARTRLAPVCDPRRSDVGRIGGALSHVQYFENGTHGYPISRKGPMDTFVDVYICVCVCNI